MTTTETVKIPMQTRAAAVSPSSIDTEKRTVELVWTTGAAVARMDWRNGEIFQEKLSVETKHIRMSRLETGAPLLNTHARYSLQDVIGVVEKAWVKDGEGRAIVRLSQRADVEPIWKDLQDGIIRNVSVGYVVHKFEDVTEKGAKQRTLLATDWEPSEISLVAIGADAAAGIRAESPTNQCEIIHDVSEQSESIRTEDETTTGHAAPPAEADGAQIENLRLLLELLGKE